MQTIIFKYDGKIGMNYGIDGVLEVSNGEEYTPKNIKEQGFCSIWVNSGLAEYKAEKAKVIKPEIVETKEDPKEAIKEDNDDVIEEVIEEVKQVTKKRGRPAKK